jgi:hypothetical protein
MKNWKTTLAGLMTAVALANPHATWSNLLAALGTFLMGLAAKDHDGGPSYPAKPGPSAPIVLLLLLAVLAYSVAGCAVNRQSLRSELHHPDGIVETQTTKSTTLAFWDAKDCIQKLRLSNGKTQTIGLTGVDSEATATNVVATLEKLVDLAKSLRPPGT